MSSNPAISSLLEFNRAALVSTEDEGLTTDGVMTIVWDKIPANQLENARVWALENRISIEDPVVSYKTMEGVWRSVSVDIDTTKSQGGALNHKFARGYADAIIEAEARLLQVDGIYAEDTLVIKRYFPNIQPKFVIPLTNQLKTVASVTNPMVFGEVIVGTFASSLILGDVNKEIRRGRYDDGVGSITQTLTKINEIEETDPDDIGEALDELDHLCSTDDTLLNALGIWPEDSSAASGHRQICVWKNMATDDATVLACRVTVTDDILEATFADATYTVVARRFEKLADGTGKYTLAFEMNEFTNTWATANQELMAEMNTQGYGLQEVITVEGISEANRDASQALAEADVAGKVTSSVRVTEKPDGERAITRTQASTFTTTGEGTEEDPYVRDQYLIVRWSASTGSRPRKMSRIWHRRNKTDKEALVGEGGEAMSDFVYTWPVSGASEATYTHMSAVVTDHGDGAYTITQQLTGLYTSGGEYTDAIWDEETYTYKSRPIVRKQSTGEEFITGYLVTKYYKYMGTFREEEDCYQYVVAFVLDVANALRPVVTGSIQVSKRGRNRYMLRFLATVTQDIKDTWPAAPEPAPEE